MTILTILSLLFGAVGIYAGCSRAFKAWQWKHRYDETVKQLNSVLKRNAEHALRHDEDTETIRMLSREITLLRARSLDDKARIVGLEQKTAVRIVTVEKPFALSTIGEQAIIDAINRQKPVIAEAVKPAMVLTPEAEEDRANFVALYGFGGNCSCHISPPCGSCTHPGNPDNQEDDSCWMTAKHDEPANVSEGGDQD